jgi:hypothetical protein
MNLIVEFSFIKKKIIEVSLDGYLGNKELDRIKSYDYIWLNYN